MTFRRFLLPLLIVAFGCRAGLTFSGLSNTSIEIAAEASTGLAAIYVLPTTSGVVMTDNSLSADAKWYAFSSLGGAYAEELGTGSSQACRQGDMGYIAEDRGRQICYWIVDYSTHQLRLDALELSDESSCDRTIFNFTGYAAEIPYYSITGRRMTLSRDMEVGYNTLVFDDESFSYRQEPSIATVSDVNSLLAAPAALCNTEYTLEGDRFLRAWGMSQEIYSPTVPAISVAAQTRATQTPRDAGNEIKDAGGDGDALGGSAPCEITFEAVVSDAAIFHEWQISKSADFSTLENSFNELEFTYTFEDQGITYVRFTADNADGTCPFESVVYQVSIGESKLEIPNAFSPEGSPGTNDEWKVSYKSLVSYECHIFNRWGKELFASTDPAQGWDGKVGGKYVPSGVYFYVIKAVGADGVKYNRAGDINIIKYKTETYTNTEE